MRRVALAALAAVSAMGAAAASAADSASAVVELTGDVDPTCTIGSFAVVGAASNASFDGTDGITVTNPTDDSAIAQPFNITLAADAMCNFTHGLKLASSKGGIELTPPSSSSNFANVIDYIANLQFPFVLGGPQLTLNTTATATSVQSTGHGPAEGTLSLNIQANASTLPSDPLLAGSYSDTLTVTIGQLP